MRNNSSRDLVQIAILVLLGANLAVTTSLWFDKRDLPAQTNQKIEALPNYADSEELNRIASEVQSSYNSSNYEKLYAMFDEEARLQFSLEDMVREFGKLEAFLGSIEGFAYSKFVPSGSVDRKAYTMHYTLKLGGGEFSNGRLIVTAVDRGDHFGIFSIKLNGGL